MCSPTHEGVAVGLGGDGAEMDASVSHYVYVLIVHRDRGDRRASILCERHVSRTVVTHSGEP